MKRLALLSFSLLLLYSCGSIKPAAPDLPLSQLSETPLPESRIDIPLSINLESILNDYTSRIPSEVTGEGKVGPAKYTWQATRQPFGLSFLGDTMHITDNARFNISGFIKKPI